jgi:hypothetical protein
MNRIPVVLFSDRAKAEAVQQRLSQAGFKSRINQKPPLAKLWFVSRDAAGVRVEVQREDCERAEQLLLKWHSSEDALRHAIRCPECGSLRVDYPQYAKHSLLTNLALGLLAELRLLERDYYCEDCHYAWPKEGTRPRRDRPHLAPFYFIEGVEQSSLGGIRDQSPVPGQQPKAP